MDIEYLHLYVRDAPAWQDWFVKTLGFRALASDLLMQLGECAVQSAQVLILLSSDDRRPSEAGAFLQKHSEGVADVAFRVQDLDAAIARLQAVGERLLAPVKSYHGATGSWRWCRIQGVGSLCHTLIEPPSEAASPFAGPSPSASADFTQPAGPAWLSIDHAVLNVPAGMLAEAVTWYKSRLGFMPEQRFDIATARSGLHSVVLKHPDGNATLPVNEPTSANSQIQEFLDLHGGAGIQHVALRTSNLVQAVSVLRRRGLAFLSVPGTYYQQLRDRPGFWSMAGDWAAIAQQQILVDWPAEAPKRRLLQTFTQPPFEKPTFFWEFIERQIEQTSTGTKQAEGFGAGNFQALFEAIEREQQQRGSL